MSWSIWDRIQESEREEKNVMVKHLVMWNFKEDFPEEKKEEMAKEADARLKALVGQIKGLSFAEM